MVREDLLDVEQLICQCEGIIRKLGKSNNVLDQYISAFNDFASSDLQGSGYAAVREQLNEYAFLCNAIKLTNAILTKECNELKEKIGDEKLDGSIIIDNIENMEKMIQNEMASLAMFSGAKSTSSDDMKDYYDTMIKRSHRNLEADRALLKYWQEQAQKFDDIVAATSHLFAFDDNIRFLVRQGIKALAKNFTGKDYKNDSQSSWKDGINTLFGKWADSRTAQVERKIIKITDENGNEWHGGDQIWLFDGKTKESWKVAEKSCSIIGVIDFMLYLEGIESISRTDYVNYVMDFFNKYPKMYEKYKSGDGYMPVEPYYPEESVLKILNDVATPHGFFGADWSTAEKIDIWDIEDQLKHNIPVLYSISATQPGVKDLPFYQKNSNGQLEAVTTQPMDAVAFSQYELAAKVFNGSLPEADKNGEYPVSLSGHTVLITAMEQIPDLETGEISTAFKVNSWGREFYVKHDEMMEYKKENLGARDWAHQSYHSQVGTDNVAHIQYREPFVKPKEVDEPAPIFGR